MLSNCGVGEDSWESLELQDQTNPSLRKLILNIHWKDWCWSWNSNSLATWWEELTHLKRPWCWERLKLGGKEDNRDWDGWMASVTQWTWVWASSGSWWWTRRPGVQQCMGSQRVGHDWGTELTEPPTTIASFLYFFSSSPLLFQDQWIAVSPHSSGNSFVTKPSSLANKSFVAIICSYFSSWLYITRFLAIAAVRE